METVIVKNGAEEAKMLVQVAMMSIRVLLEDNPIAFYELVMCCRDREHVPFGNTGEALQGLNLYPLHDSLRNVVLSAVTGDGLEMALGSPV